ncbi:L,D-transpeptidase family protein [Streptomyces sp. A73]|uniref:L,D-transpeptidase family protein n=1 Tax=Streptomyces sp. RK75 TaxID=2824895 RepID=UPI001B35FA13|nr:L,D-transpeptidase family protein [Streptomyces sp. RK75]MBQ0868553.1 L,D-transpeptidase family protein [Streptomyces sp. RK75]MBQ1156975.1 L,D-transpeptidase family protein [Streptomyces sp. A73]
MGMRAAGRTGTGTGRHGAAAARPREVAQVRAPGRARARAAVVAAAGGTVLALLLSGCGGDSGGGSGGGDQGSGSAKKATASELSPQAELAKHPTRIPRVGDRLQAKIPDNAEQVVAVEGKGKDSADATVRLYTRHGEKWREEHSWAAHNGKKGWTNDHHEGDKRTPVGMFTLSDAGGVLPEPDAKLPYTQTSAFTPPSYWPKKTRHDFDHVIAIDYNRVKSTSPLDPTRPQGKAKGGSIWLHMDHGSGTSGCVSLSKSGMRTLLRTLSPDKHPVVVMGDKASLKR